MKKDKVKSNKRRVRDDIKLSLVTELKALTGKFGDATEKLNKEINRSAKKLAKKISKEMKIEEPVVSEHVKAPKAAQASAPAQAPKAVQTPKPAQAAKPVQASKPAPKATPAPKAVNNVDGANDKKAQVKQVLHKNGLS
jgi:hypothetical protein